MTASHRGIIFNDGQNLTVPQNTLPDGDFLLPVCINRDDLHRMLSVLWEGRFLLPDDPPNSEVSDDVHTLRHMRGVLEALAYINRPCEVPCFECDSCDDGCIEFLPNAAIIEYFPNDPFRTPSLIPPGYTRPPWYTDATFPIGGILPTDAMVDTLSVFAPALPLSGFPYARIHFSGVGEIEIELVQVPFGGIVVIDIDDDPTQLTIVDCSSDIIDLVSISGILAALGFDVEDANLVGTKVIELEVTTPGEHFIDVNFIPSFGGETLLGFGGGIRRVSLCGLSVPGEFMPYQLRQNPEDACSVQQSNDAGLTWSEAFRMDNCCCDDNGDYFRYTDEGIKETSPDGITWTPDREGDPRFFPPTAPPLPIAPGNDLRCQSANNVTGWLHATADDFIAKAALGSGVSYVLSILIPLLIIVVSGATGGLATPLMLALAGALASTGGAAFDAAMTAGVYEQFCCIVYCRTPNSGVYTEANWQAIKADILSTFSGIAARFLHDQINAMGIAGLNNAGRVGVGEGFDCDGCDCSNACIDETNIIIGSFVSQSESAITIEAVLTTHEATTAYWVVYGSNTGDFCCFLCDQVWTPDIDAGTWYDCDGVLHTAGSPINNEVRRIQYFRAAATFQVTLTFSDIPCP